MGHALAPATGRILDAVAPVIERFSAWVEKNPNLLQPSLCGGWVVSVVLTAVGSLLMVLRRDQSWIGRW